MSFRSFISIAVMAAFMVFAFTPHKPSEASEIKSSPADQSMRTALSHALQGDGAAAVTTLRAIEPAELSEKLRNVRSCMLERLDTKAPLPAADDRFLAGVLSAYRKYWVRSLLVKNSTSENETKLLEELNSIVAANNGKRAEKMDDMESTLMEMIQKRGHHALFGVTLPLREFMLWKTQTPKQDYRVQLPQGEQQVGLVFMDDFVSLGWAGYATCDYRHSGGWTKPDALYAVRSAYDLESENFKVNYLAHEAQHFWDQTHFPDLEQPELEYRAKLVEISLAQADLYKLLDGFAANTGSDRTVPHSFANGRVINDLRAELFQDQGNSSWEQKDAKQINAAAKKLLLKDTKQRKDKTVNN